MKKEIWKDILGYEGLYQVSNFGRVKSLERLIKYTENKIVLRKCRIIKTHTNKCGYVYVVLHKDGNKKNYLVHRLVAEVFISNPDNLPQVNHKDENKLNNSVENLEWCDAKYNVNYGTCIERRSKKRGRSVDVFKNDIFIETITSANLCAKKYKTTQSIIYRCCNKGYFCKKRQKWVNVSKYKEYNFKWHNEE